MLEIFDDDFIPVNKNNLLDKLDKLDDNALEILSHNCDALLQGRWYVRNKGAVGRDEDKFISVGVNPFNPNSSK